jgi:hypothetical protein
MVNRNAPNYLERVTGASNVLPVRQVNAKHNLFGSRVPQVKAKGGGSLPNPTPSPGTTRLRVALILELAIFVRGIIILRVMTCVAAS